MFYADPTSTVINYQPIRANPEESDRRQYVTVTLWASTARLWVSSRKTLWVSSRKTLFVTKPQQDGWQARALDNSVPRGLGHWTQPVLHRAWTAARLANTVNVPGGPAGQSAITFPTVGCSLSIVSRSFIVPSFKPLAILNRSTPAF